MDGAAPDTRNLDEAGRHRSGQGRDVRRPAPAAAAQSRQGGRAAHTAAGGTEVHGRRCARLAAAVVMASLRVRAQSARRARELASDKRAGTAPRLIARRAQHEYLRRNGARLALGGIALVVAALAPVAFLPGDFLNGVTVGA